MKKSNCLPLQKLTLSIFLIFYSGIFAFPALAQQADRPLSIDLNAGGGLIGNSENHTAFQPEIGVSYMPGSWGVGLNAGIYSFDSGFNADQYRTGFEQFTQTTGDEEKWKAFFINAGPRYQFGSRLPVKFTAGLDLAMSYQNPPNQQVEFYNPDSEPGADLQEITLAGMEAVDNNQKWNAALRPQMEIGFQPFRSNRIGFSIKTGVQYALSKREITYSQSDLSDVRSVDSAYEMYFQFENAPVVQRTETAPRANFFANAGIKIRFGSSKTSSAAPAQDYNAARSNKPTSIAADGADGGNGDVDADSIETAQDYNSSRSNKPRTETPDDIRDDCDDEDDCHGPDTVNRAQDYNAARSNKPTSIAADDILDIDSDDDAIETAQDYNSSRSNKPSSIADGTGGGDGITFSQAIAIASLANPTGTIIKVGSITAKGKKALGMAPSNGKNPLYEGESVGGENPLAKSEANDGDSDNNDNDDPAPVQRYDLQPSSYCVELGASSQQGRSAEAQDYNAARSNKPTSRAADTGDGDLDSDDDGVDDLVETAQDYNSSRSNKPSSIADIGDFDSDGFPDVMKSASFSISKRSARTGRNESSIHEGDTNTQTSPLYESKDELANNGGDLDGDGYGDADGLLFELEIDPLDPDDDGDGVTDAIESASFSISKRSARTGRSAGREIETMESQEGTIANRSGNTQPTDDVHQWTYKLSELEGAGDLPAGTLTVLFTGGAWHFDVQVNDFNDLDSDDDGITDLIQNSSFSISKRSARQ